MVVEDLKRLGQLYYVYFDVYVRLVRLLKR